MSASEDVKTLFRRFGGEPETYQEVIRDQQVVQSVGKWAMLGQVDLNQPLSIPAVRRVVQTALTRPSTESAIPLAELMPMRRAMPEASTDWDAQIKAAPSPDAEATAILAASAIADPLIQPAPVQAPPIQHTPQAVQPAPAAVPVPDVAVAAATERTLTSTPLANRLKSKLAPAVEPVAAEPEPPVQSLTSLFGRLAGPTMTDAKVGVLRRKFNK